MFTPLVPLLSAAAILSVPLSDDCGFFPSPSGDRVLLACRPSGELRLTVTTAGGQTTTIDDVETDMARHAVPTGPAAWSPYGDAVALEIGLDEEPGVLLITLKDRPTAIFVDRVLADANVSGAQPHWDRSGEWLIFATSGTGDWANEGVYALRINDGAVFRLLDAVPRRIKVAGDFLYVERVDRDAPERSILANFKIPELIRGGERVATVDMPRRRRQQKQ